jgi:hypothetical protein
MQDTYTIISSDEGWSLDLNGQQLAEFDEEYGAMQAASVAARMSESRGRTAEIHIREWNTLRITA